METHKSVMTDCRSTNSYELVRTLLKEPVRKRARRQRARRHEPVGLRMYGKVDIVEMLSLRGAFEGNP